MKPLEELLNRDDPAWPLVQDWINAASNAVEVLPANETQRGAALYETQVTTRSPLGAVIYETGGLLIDGGWLRILGSGHPRLPRSLPRWNQACGVAATDFVLLADDVMAGFFAMNGGALGADKGTVYYFAPDALEWESLDRGYSDFLRFCFSGDLQKFYESFRWNGWQAEIAALTGD
jgi:hypothetical protein